MPGASMGHLSRRAELASLFNISGSIFPKTFKVAAPCALATALFKVLDVYLFHENARFEFFVDSISLESPLAFSTFTWMVGFLVIFKSSMAYARFWEGTSQLTKMFSTTLNAVRFFMSAASDSGADREKILEFQTMYVRLVSLWYGFCMGHLQAVEVDPSSPAVMEAIDPSGLDDQTLGSLCDPKVNKVELITAWIQRLCTQAVRDGVLDLPPPVLTKGFMDWTAAIKAFHGCLKITQTPYPRPQLQVVLWFLILHWFLAPFVMVHWTKSIIYAALFTFCQVFILWALYDTARMLEDPFGNDPTDLHLEQANNRMNESLLALLDSAVADQLPKGQSYATRGCAENWENGTLRSRVPTTTMEVTPKERDHVLWLKRRFGYSGQTSTNVFLSSGVRQRCPSIESVGQESLNPKDAAARTPYMPVSTGRTAFLEPRAQPIGQPAVDIDKQE